MGPHSIASKKENMTVTMFYAGNPAGLETIKGVIKIETKIDDGIGYYVLRMGRGETRLFCQDLWNITGVTV